MKKTITFGIPCYNSAAYMDKCVESILVGSDYADDVQIVIVDDGSAKDETPAKADEWQQRYPNIVKAVHQENGGHGAAVNTGLKNATGLYFKVVDSDDWVNRESYEKILHTLEELVKGSHTVDLLISNFVYEKQGAVKKRVMHYRHCFPTEEVFTWDQVKHMPKGKYLLMHSLIYRTKLLVDCGLELPRHTFYVDNIFVYYPLPYVKTLYYMDIDLYQYYLGRDDQSVNEQMLKKRIDQQMKVTRMVIAGADLTKIKEKEPKLASYMYRNISIMMAISSIHLLLIGNEEALEKRKNLWGEIKTSNPKLYYKLKYASLSGWTDLPGAVGRRLTIGGYRLANAVYRFQ